MLRIWLIQATGAVSVLQQLLHVYRVVVRGPNRAKGCNRAKGHRGELLWELMGDVHFIKPHAQTVQMK